VPAVTGSVSLRLPAGTQSGQVFNLRGRGLPRVNASGVGDLHVRVQLWTPEKLSDEESSIIRQLAALQERAPQARTKGFWNKMKEVLGA
jgi:molecular chaperone DnaJ